MNCSQCKVKMKTIFTNPVWKATLRYRVHLCKTCGIVKETLEAPIEWMPKKFKAAIAHGRKARACVYRWLKQ